MIASAAPSTASVTASNAAPSASAFDDITPSVAHALIIAIMCALALVSYFAVVVHQATLRGEEMRHMQMLTGHFGDGRGRAEQSSRTNLEQRELAQR